MRQLRSGGHCDWGGRLPGNIREYIQAFVPWALRPYATPFHRLRSVLMVFSKSAEYGLRATLFLVAFEHDSYVSMKVIGEELDISVPFLTKIFQKLTKAGILKSSRGPKGGVALARSAEEITLREIVEAIDGPAIFTECVLGLPGCGERNPCPIHDEWSKVRARLKRLFESRTLAEMRDRLKDQDFRLALRP